MSEITISEKIQIVKNKIIQLSDLHESLLDVSNYGGSNATDIIEKRQAQYFNLLEELVEENKKSEIKIPPYMKI